MSKILFCRIPLLPVSMVIFSSSAPNQLCQVNKSVSKVHHLVFEFFELPMKQQ
jgi:hypothetical protein